MPRAPKKSVAKSAGKKAPARESKREPKAKGKAAPPPSEDGGSAGPGPFWAGTITFGLVSVPVNLYPAHRADGVPMRMLGPEGTPVARRYYCEQDGKEVGRDHLVRGFEIEPGKHVIVTDEEMDRLAPKKTRDIELKRFVDAGSLDPIFFDRPYFLTPGSESTKAYRLLAAVMERTKRAGIASFVMHGRERIVAILAENGILRAQTLRFSDEVRTPEEIGLPEPVEPGRGTVGEFEKAIAAKSKAGIATDEMDDPYLDALKKLVETKKKTGERIIARSEPEEDDEDEPIDLVEILKRSLKEPSRGRAAAPKRRAASSPAPSSASARGRTRRRA